MYWARPGGVFLQDRSVESLLGFLCPLDYSCESVNCQVGREGTGLSIAENQHNYYNYSRNTCNGSFMQVLVHNSLLEHDVPDPEYPGLQVQVKEPI